MGLAPATREVIRTPSEESGSNLISEQNRKWGREQHVAERHGRDPYPVLPEPQTCQDGTRRGDGGFL